jgi:hypothetical protein
MHKDAFIRATEVWVPTADGRHIDLEAGLYGDLDYFKAVSRGMRFAYGEGLPGKTWGSGRPIVLKDLRNSYFQRGDAAMTEGLSCAVAVPSFDGETLKSVIVFFCGDDRFRVGALEVWNAPEGELELRLEDGYFGRAEKFEFTSRNTRFPRRMGLPGRVWDSGRPEVMEDLGRGQMFLRRDAAEKVGINRAIGIPCSSLGEEPWVLTFLSARNTPIAGRFEIWDFDSGRNAFAFREGYCESGANLAPDYAGANVPTDNGPFAKAHRMGVPVVVEDISREAGPVVRSAMSADLHSMVVLPIHDGGGYNTLLAWFV